ncbi:MAG: phosphocholine cytidylyltransferase family protein, partial [Clostridia bacterium]|nr:phosphocholine cytidylyltransferase family protein [Clostridia bacterium]
MKALILNSGMGSRMGVLTSEHPKCMTDLPSGETILERQLKMLSEAGISDIVITTGYYHTVLEEYCSSLGMPVRFSFVYNPLYEKTNYIYSMYCARELLKGEDVVLLHGDLVFEFSVLRDIASAPQNCMKVSSTEPLPSKDFKAVIRDGRVAAVGVEFFESAMEAQALYKFRSDDFGVWMDRIAQFCESGRTECYAEAALNEISSEIELFPFDVRDSLC